MQQKRLAALAAALVIGVSGSAFAQSVAVVNGVAIDKKEVDEAVSALVKNSGGKMQDTPALRDQIKDSRSFKE